MQGSVVSRIGDFVGATRHYRKLTSVGTPRAELLALQQRRLVETARNAVAASPFYRELYRGIELADDLDVRALPVVTKAMLMERFDEWVSDPRLRRSEVEGHLEQVRGDELYLGEYRCMPTGGSTGYRGIFVYDRDEWRQCLAAFLRWSELTGARPRLGRRRRVASVGATSPLHMTARFGMSLDLGVYALCRLDARMPFFEVVGALNEHRPEQLVAYPSMASLLAVEQLEGRLKIAPTVVATSSEVRTEEMTANIREAWGVEPFDMYGTTESLYAGDCEHHQGMHVFEDLALMEVVDERGDPVPDGVTGAKLLVTSFIKHTQPVLRYEVSDMVARSSAPCPCGRPLARIVSLEGRSDDVLEMTGAGGRTVSVHPLTLRSPMAALPELRQYKIVHDDDGLHVLVVLRDAVPGEDVSRRVEATLGAKLHDAGVAYPRLDVTIVDELPREQGDSAKFKLVESRAGPQAAAPPTIDEIVLADEPASWVALGFTVADGCCQLGRVRLRLAGRGAGRGIVSWSLRDITGVELDGLPTTRSQSPVPAAAPVHPNGVLAIDHVVAMSPVLDRTVRALEAAGLDLRRIREEPTPAGAPRQAFFRLASEILEVVQEPDDVVERGGGPDRPAHLWGLALLVEDLDRTVEGLGPDVSPIRTAIQPGRRIATLGRSAGLGVPVALMSRPPEPKDG